MKYKAMNRRLGTTISTSRALIEAGVDAQTADMKWSVVDGEWDLAPLHHVFNVKSESYKSGKAYPAWSWDCLFSMLPTAITIKNKNGNLCNCRLSVVRNGTEIVEHRYMPIQQTDPDEFCEKTCSHPIPVESAAEMVIWLHKRADEDTDGRK